MVRNPCDKCHGSGQETRVVNPRWPEGTEPHIEETGEDCPQCNGTGRAVTLVKVSSHRARQRMTRITGTLQAYFSWKREGEFYFVPDEQLEQVLAIKSINRARRPADLMRCWPTGFSSLQDRLAAEQS